MDNKVEMKRDKFERVGLDILLAITESLYVMAINEDVAKCN